MLDKLIMVAKIGAFIGALYLVYWLMCSIGNDDDEC